MTHRKNCRGCGGSSLVGFCDLGTCPPSNSYISSENLNDTELYLPLRTFVCSRCWLVQTDDVAMSQDLFTEDYAYLSSTSETWQNHAADYAAMISNRLALDSTSTITEIASNDGYLLRNFLNIGANVYGIEPTRLAATISEEQGIDTVVQFFSEQLAHKLVKERGQSDLIICNNVLAHVPDIKDFLRGLEVLLSADGTITIEFPHLLNLIKHSQYDTIYHEHFSYISLLSLCNICDDLSISVYDVEEINTHGGSLRVYLTKSNLAKTLNTRVRRVLQNELEFGLDKISTYQKFQQTVQESKLDILKFLVDAKIQGKSIYGFGAAAKCNTLLNYCGLHADIISGIFDNAQSKIGNICRAVKFKYLICNKVGISILMSR